MALELVLEVFAASFFVQSVDEDFGVLLLTVEADVALVLVATACGKPARTDGENIGWAPKSRPAAIALKARDCIEALTGKLGRGACSETVETFVGAAIVAIVVAW